jgi:serine/threonine protein kinase
MKYNQKSDIWSLGCVLYKLMMLKYPFESTSNFGLNLDILAMMAKMEKKNF